METNIKILSYNVFLRPSGIMSNINLNGDYKNDRLNTIATIITNYDIILLQEIFDFNLLSTKKDKLIKLVKNAGINYNAYSNKASFKPVDSGLLILSKFPIVEIDSVTYDSCFCIDILSAKGILYAKLLLPNNEYLHIINTHTQAGDSKINHETKMKQLYFLSNYIDNKIPKNETLIVGGDLNLDSIHDIKFKNNYYKLKRTVESIDYKQFINLLSKNRKVIDCLSKTHHKEMLNKDPNKYIFNIDKGIVHISNKIPENNKIIDIPFFNKHIKLYSKLKNYTLHHPITTFGHAELGTYNKNNNKKLRSLDYIFLLPSNNNNFKIKLIYCITKPFINIDSINNYICLSDHYGIESIFRIKTNKIKYQVNYIEK